jgi:hypothetical protein
MTAGKRHRGTNNSMRGIQAFPEPRFAPPPTALEAENDGVVLLFRWG